MEAVLVPFSESRSFNPQNFSPATVHGGLFNFPPPAVTYFSHRHHQQPPLLPLPRRPFPPPETGATAFCRPKCKSRDQSLTPKKSKPIKRSKGGPPAVKSTVEFVIVDSTNRLGPEPSHVPKDLWKVLGLQSSAPPCEGSRSLGTAAEMEFSGSAFSVSPPPSSVPLPKFSLRRKVVSCNVEAAGVDAGATDNLRRLLRLR
ncbi:uncharacterized protein LOC120075485 [Benincasa hispida]|uniref:uncharacterized protein LOC120075485 n=1 Tax=Benincasa hispida TaxID=102211 RepID=UPI001901054E|nr:uncharacterized protein LOC120075485 [Benincasa hispida]